MIFFMSLREASPELLSFRPTYPGYISAIIDIGRELSLVCMLALILVNTSKLKSVLTMSAPAIPRLIFLLQLILMTKLFLYGSVWEAASGLVVISIQIFLLIKLAAHFQLNGKGFIPEVVSKCAVMGVIFNAFLFIAFSDAAHVDQQRFVGAMPNPQHMMMFLTLCVPGLLYSALRSQTNLSKSLYISLSLLAYFLIIQTGSRTGVAAASLVLIVFLFSLPTIISFLLTMLTTLAVVVQFAGSNASIIIGYFFERGDTRSHVYAREWQKFLENPLWGVPLEDNARFVFSENVWLSFLSNGGVLAGILLFAILVSLLRRSIKLMLRWDKSDPRYFFFFSGSLAMSVISLFESIFAGTYSSFALLSFLYLTFPLSSHKLPPQQRQSL